MRHQMYNSNFKFVREPESFDKYTDLDLLKYCLGATMYMPGTKDFYGKIINKAFPELTTMVLCFEDACPEDQVEQAQDNVIELLRKLNQAINDGIISKDEIPLIFIRVRNVEQFKSFSKLLEKDTIYLLTGFNFPKFNSSNGEQFFSQLKLLNKEFNELLYGMPIIEDAIVAYKEFRVEELLKIKTILDKYKDLVLQVRVGAVDLASSYGLRRMVSQSIYDVMIVRECLSDILNIFARNNEYVVAGPVFEYFSNNIELNHFRVDKDKFYDRLERKDIMFNPETDGLIKDVMLDKLNGFVGRTIIHPTHIKFVNALHAVTKDDYEDAVNILGSCEAVFKSSNHNKMNETRPHTIWAVRIVHLAKAFGVVESENSYLELLGYIGG